MTALNNLAEFVYKLPDELQPEFMKLVDAVTDERDRLQSERIATSQAITGTFEVVAVAGTAETLLTDVTDTNVGEIKYGNTVECIRGCYPINGSTKYPFILKGETLIVDLVFGKGISFEGYGANYYASNFRKAPTPIVYQHQNVSGC
jgi:hypothetical protein